MLTDIHQARDELKALSTGSEGKIHIGVFPASTSVLLPQALMLLKQRSPGTNVLVTEGTAVSLLPELWQGKLDMVVGRLPSRNAMNGFEEKALLEEPVLLMTGRHHPLAKKKKLQWSDLKSYPWVLPPMDSMVRDPLERALMEHGVPLSNNYIETLSTHLARAYLHISDAIAVMAGAAAHDASDKLAVLPLTLPKLVRPAGVLWSKNRSLSQKVTLHNAGIDDLAGLGFHALVVERCTAFAFEHMRVFADVDVCGEGCLAQAVQQEGALAVQRAAADGLHKAAQQTRGQRRLKQHGALRGRNFSAFQARQSAFSRVTANRLRAGQVGCVTHRAVPGITLHLTAFAGNRRD